MPTTLPSPNRTKTQHSVGSINWERLALLVAFPILCWVAIATGLCAALLGW